MTHIHPNNTISMVGVKTIAFPYPFMPTWDRKVFSPKSWLRRRWTSKEIMMIGHQVLFQDAFNI